MRRYALSAIVLGCVFVAGWLVGRAPFSQATGQTQAPDSATELLVDLPDPADPTGRRLTEYTIYRITSADRGIVFGTAAPPPADGPRPVIVTLQGRERIAYYGLPKPRTGD
jgi:hypothetical protein